MLSDKILMEAAKKASYSSTCKKRQIGCLLICKKGYMSGTNGAPKPLDPCEICPRINAFSGKHLERCYALHAEAQALALCARTRLSTQDSILYLYNAMPCKTCLLSLIEAGVKEIICSDRVYYDPLSREIFESWQKTGGILRFMEID